MRIINHDEVAQQLTPGLAIASLQRALDEQARGAVQMPPRQTTDAGSDSGGLDKHTGNNWLRISSAFLNEQGYMGFKAMNRSAGLGMRYLIGLYRIESGDLVAVFDANEITTARTAATSALGTHLLARADANRVGLLGAGVQARALLRTLAQLRPLDRVSVFSPTESSRIAFASELSEELDIEVVPVDSPAAAVEHADIGVAAFRATKEPVVPASWFTPGFHFTGLSSVRHDAREVHKQVWAACDLVVVDDRGTVGQSGDAIAGANEGFDVASVPELYQVQSGEVGRVTDEDVTMFKSAGNAMQDISLAAAVYTRLTDLAESEAPGYEYGPFPIVKPYA